MLVKKTLLIIMLALLPAVLRPETSEVLNRSTRIELSNTIRQYYAQDGDKRQATAFRPFLWTASRAAKWFPIYPAANETDRVLKMLTYGANETHFRLNVAEANVPGAKIFGGRKHIRFFSIDVMWTGMNEQNLKWTYEVARLLQDGKKIPKGYGNKRFRNALMYCHVPKDIKLTKIDMAPIAQAHKDWVKYKHKGYDPRKIKSLIKIQIDENSQDDIDSAMIYRILVELDRYSRGWDIDTYDKELYERLSDGM